MKNGLPEILKSSLKMVRLPAKELNTKAKQVLKILKRDKKKFKEGENQIADMGITHFNQKTHIQKTHIFTERRITLQGASATATLTITNGWGSKHYRFILKFKNHLRSKKDRAKIQSEYQEQRTCSVKGCHRFHHGRGYCTFHYFRYKRGADILTGENPADSRLKDYSKDICSAKGKDAIGEWKCDRASASNKQDLCNSHHKAFMADRPFNRLKQKFCSIEGCSQAYFLSGLCKLHYRIRIERKKTKKRTQNKKEDIMFYIKKTYNNGYYCGCCRHEYEHEDKAENLEEAIEEHIPDEDELPLNGDHDLQEVTIEDGTTGEEVASWDASPMKARYGERPSILFWWVSRTTPDGRTDKIYDSGKETD